MYDVLVVGGGPGGSTTAALLAQRGRRVALIEKDRHPRFHIGESLLPQNNRLFETLGVMDDVRRIGLHKPGVEFHSLQHDKGRQEFFFCDAVDKSHPSGFEVHRAELDELLFRNAARLGAETVEEHRIVEVDVGSEGVRLVGRGPDGEREWRGRYLVDATGRDTLMSARMKLKRPHPRHNSAAIFAHYEGAQRLPGVNEGNISIFWFEHGWFWFIPLTHGVTSVGAVCWPYYLKRREGSLDAFFAQTVASCPPLAQRLADARQLRPATATGNYSYLSTRASGDRYLMVGDAFAFVDPVFSSGVYLAMSSGEMATQALDTVLDNEAAAPRLFADYEKQMRRGLDNFSWFIFRMTNPLMRDLIMNPRNMLGVADGVISLFAGDVFGKPAVDWRIRFFKGIYLASNMMNPRRSLAARRQRQENIRSVPA